MISIPGYKDYEEIGKGGMATVYRAIQESTDRHVAIKVMSPSLASDASFTERFLKEARMAYLSHPNIITVHDSGKIDDSHYIVMEYASGGNFDKKIKAGLSAAEVVKIILQVANALAYAAKNHVVHRDVKPDNILLKEDNTALLVDFGIAKAITSGDKLTMVGMAVGSSHYMSPEQARGFEIDSRSDLYSLGIVLYEALMGKIPYEGGDTFAVAIKHINDPIPIFPKEFEQFQPIIDKLLAKDPDDRYQDANQLIYALEDLYSDLNQVDLSNVNEKFSQALPNARKKEKNKSEVENDPHALTAVNRHINAHDLDDRTVIKAVPEALQASNNNSHKGTKKNLSYLPFLLVSVAVLGAGLTYYFANSLGNVKNENVSPIVVAFKFLEPIVPEKTKKIEPIKEVPLVLESPKQPVVDTGAVLIAELLAKAKTQLNKTALTSPKGKNAYETYQQVLDLDSDNSEAMQGINSIAEKYYQLSIKQERKGKIKKALQYADKGLGVDKNNEKLQQWREELLALRQLPILKTAFFNKNLSAFKMQASHKSVDRYQAENYAKLALGNRVYAVLTKDCNKNIRRLTSDKCTELLQHSYSQWPVPTIFAKYQSRTEKGYIRGSFKAKRMLSVRRLETKINTLFQVLKNSTASDENKKLAYANLLHFQPLVSLAGMKIYDVQSKTVEKILTEESKKQKLIRSISKLLDIIDDKFGADNSVLQSITSESSLEITPYAAALYGVISKKSASKDDQQSTLYGKYRLLKSGNVNLDFWQFDNNNEIIAIERFKLSKTIFRNFRRNNIVFIEDLLPDSLNQQGEYLGSEIALSNVSSHRLSIIGEKVKLQIKMDEPGYYYIAMHVTGDDGAFSYLLPLKRGNSPFVKTVGKQQVNRFVNLGELKITPPAGVEIMQLITSNVDLEKYLPATKWSKSQKSFIIENTNSGISTGLNIVRSAVNKMSRLSKNNNPRWQERLLVTSIVSKSD